MDMGDSCVLLEIIFLYFIWKKQRLGLMSLFFLILNSQQTLYVGPRLSLFFLIDYNYHLYATFKKII